jgi:hypothetical protein
MTSGTGMILGTLRRRINNFVVIFGYEMVDLAPSRISSRR